jgi:hypothetical protein
MPQARAPTVIVTGTLSGVGVAHARKSDAA